MQKGIVDNKVNRATDQCASEKILGEHVSAPLACLSVADSGYGAENSPLSLAHSAFSVGDDSDVPEQEEDLDFDDVFGVYNDSSNASGGFDLHEQEISIETCREVDSGDADAVKSSRNSSDCGQRLSAPITIRNKCATRDGESRERQVNDIGEHASSVPDKHWSGHYRHRYMFGHSCGTQTLDWSYQSAQCVLDEEPKNVNAPRARGYSVHIAQSITSYPPLPDVIPEQRGRSVSTSAMPSILRTESQQNVGRELRRISDEFHHTFSHKQETTKKPESSSVPLSFNFDFHSYWAGLRRIVSTPVFKPGSQGKT